MARPLKYAPKLKPQYILPEGESLLLRPSPNRQNPLKNPILAPAQGTWVMGLFTMISEGHTEGRLSLKFVRLRSDLKILSESLCPGGLAGSCADATVFASAGAHPSWIHARP
jgi:hypothetical protein